jgi:hypothetical protein
MKFLPLYLILLFPLFVLNLKAAGGEDTKCKLRFYSIQPRVVYSRTDADIKELSLKGSKYFYTNNNRISEIKLESGELTKGKTYRGSPILNFFKQDSVGRVENAEADFTVELKPAWKEALIVTKELPQAWGASKDRRSRTAEAFEWRKLEEATLRIINMSNKAIRLEIDSKPIHLASKQNYDLNLETIDGNPVSINVYDGDADSASLVYSKSLRLDKSSSLLWLASFYKNGNLLQIVPVEIKD